MDESTIKKGLHMAFSKGDVHISFFGGEPLMEYEKMRIAVQYANRLSEERNVPVRYSLTTNGTLFNESILTFLKDNRFHVAVSIDGTKASHDSTRPYINGSSSHETVFRNLQLALTMLFEVETISVIDPKNVSLLKENFLFFLASGVRDINFSINYTAQWDAASLKKLECALAELSNEYVTQYRKNTVFSLDIIDHKIISHVKGGYEGCDKCKFGDGEFCVTPKGNLYPCERLVKGDDDAVIDLVIGHVDCGIELSKVMKMISLKNAADQDCEECDYRHRCMFWCGCANVETTADVGKTSAVLCRTEQMTIRAADKAAEQLYAKKNPLFLKHFYYT
jgi:uncharacterized protein